LQDIRGDIRPIAGYKWGYLTPGRIYDGVLDPLQDIRWGTRPLAGYKMGIRPLAGYKRGYYTTYRI